MEVAMMAIGSATEQDDGFVVGGEVVQEVLCACESACAKAEFAAQHGGGVVLCHSVC